MSLQAGINPTTSKLTNLNSDGMECLSSYLTNEEIRKLNHCGSRTIYHLTKDLFRICGFPIKRLISMGRISEFLLEKAKERGQIYEQRHRYTMELAKSKQMTYQELNRALPESFSEEEIRRVQELKMQLKTLENSFATKINGLLLASYFRRLPDLAKEQIAAAYQLFKSQDKIDEETGERTVNADMTEKLARMSVQDAKALRQRLLESRFTKHCRQIVESQHLSDSNRISRMVTFVFDDQNEVLPLPLFLYSLQRIGMSTPDISSQIIQAISHQYVNNRSFRVTCPEQTLMHCAALATSNDSLLQVATSLRRGELLISLLEKCSSSDVVQYFQQIARKYIEAQNGRRFTLILTDRNPDGTQRRVTVSDDLEPEELSGVIRLILTVRGNALPFSTLREALFTPHLGWRERITIGEVLTLRAINLYTIAVLMIILMGVYIQSTRKAESTQ